MQFIGFGRVAPASGDVAKNPQAVPLLGFEIQSLRKLIARARRVCGRLAVEADHRRPLDSMELRFNGAKSARLRNLERSLGDIEGSLRLPGSERLAEPGARQRGEIR